MGGPATAHRGPGGRGAGVPGPGGLGRRGGPCSPAGRFLGFPQMFTQQGNNSFCLSSNCCSRPSPGGCRGGGGGRPRALRRPSCPPPPWPALVRPDAESPRWEPPRGQRPIGAQQGGDPGPSLPTGARASPPSETWAACPDAGLQRLPETRLSAAPSPAGLGTWVGAGRRTGGQRRPRRWGNRCVQRTHPPPRPRVTAWGATQSAVGAPGVG